MRVKIILPNFLAVLVFGLSGYFYLNHTLKSKAVERLAAQIESTHLLYERSERLNGFELLNEVTAFAMSKDVVNAFAPIDIPVVEGDTEKNGEEKIRSEWSKKCFKALEVCTELIAEKKHKRPEIVFLTDRKGLIIARNTTPNACPAGYNVSKTMPMVELALKGRPSYGIWSIDESPFSNKKRDPNFCPLVNTGLVELAAAPVLYNEDIAGILVIGFEISNGMAKKKASMLGLDVAVLTGGAVYSSSFETETARQSLEKQMNAPTIISKIESVAQNGQASAVFELKVEGKSYLALISPIASAEAKDQVVSVLMGSIDKAVADTGYVKVLLISMILMLLLVFIVGMILANHFLRPVIAIEEGLLKVINGEYKYRFDIKSSEVGGLSYRINQLIGVLTNEEEESDEEQNEE